MSKGPATSAIAALVEADGPMPIDRYMALCLGHPRFGYYMTRDPLGAQGDFTTAPEISQTFGEMIGVWLAQVWTAMGAPAMLRLIELGPGRGTLMADIVRAARALPAFEAALDIHMVETSPILRHRQAETLAHLKGRVSWHADLDTVPGGASLFVANEFFDALPIRQFERRDDAWYERVVGMDETGDIRIGLAPDATAGLDAPPGSGNGSVFELSPARAGVARRIGERCVEDAAAGIVVDYGHLYTACGDTLQAVSGHAPVPVTQEPGACDLTSHVDFQALGSALREAGAQVFEIMPQRAFLMALGIEVRARTLKQNSDAEQAGTIDAAIERLINVDQMGALFKVCAFASPHLRDIYPFHPVQS